MLKSLALIAALGVAAPAAAQAPFVDVGTQPPITILINSSPWYNGFEAVVRLYEQQTRNRVNLDVTPFNGMLEKARNSVRAGTSPHDILNLNTPWTIEFYEGGFLQPFTQIDPNFVLPAEVLTFGDSNYWNAQRRWRMREGGQLMGYSPNGNVHVLYYRTDLVPTPPANWDEMLATCENLHRPPGQYGFVVRGERGDSIRYDWTPFLHAAGGRVVRAPETGDYTVVLNSPEALRALNQYIALARRCGPPNIGVLGQGDVIQLIATGRAAMGMAVIAAWPTFEDRQRSAVVGRINAAVVPGPAGAQPAAVAGNWHFVIPRNTPAERQRAAIAFSRWFLTAGAQRAYAEGGGIPVRSDTFASDLAQRPQFRWMRAYVDSQPVTRQELGFAEGPQVEVIMGLRLNQALIGEMSPARALNTAAREIEEVLRRTGRNTGVLSPLPE
jgi:multiple sugar transport system substrate-binding protein